MIPQPKLDDVSSKYGAPMGRANVIPKGRLPVLRLVLLKMEDGDYDVGGAYWGGGPSKQGRMYVAWNAKDDEERMLVFVRANSHDEARKRVTRTVLEATGGKIPAFVAASYPRRKK